MGVLRTLRMARTAKQIEAEFAELWDAPGAYRPEVKAEFPARLNPAVAVHLLSDVANSVGATSGDAGLLACRVMAEIDRRSSYSEAFDSVMESVASGALATVSGRPMRQYVGAEAVARILEAAGERGSYRGLDRVRDERRLQRLAGWATPLRRTAL